MRSTIVALSMFALSAVAANQAAQQFPENPTMTTLAVTPLAIEGLTGDDNGNLYTTGRAPVPDRCPVWRIDETGTLVQIGSIGNAAPGCNPSGIIRDQSGNRFIADANQG